MLYLSKLISVTLIVVTTACVLLSLRTTCNPGTTRTTEVHMYWQKSGENFWGSRNQVCPVWNFPPRWQNWIKDQNHSPQTSLRCWTNQHRNPPGMADWKRQAASELGNTHWRLTWHWTIHPCQWDQGSQMSSRTSLKLVILHFYFTAHAS